MIKLREILDEIRVIAPFKKIPFNVFKDAVLKEASYKDDTEEIMIAYDKQLKEELNKATTISNVNAILSDFGFDDNNRSWELMVESVVDEDKLNEVKVVPTNRPIEIFKTKIDEALRISDKIKDKTNLGWMIEQLTNIQYKLQDPYFDKNPIDEVKIIPQKSSKEILAEKIYYTISMQSFDDWYKNDFDDLNKEQAIKEIIRRFNL